MKSAILTILSIACIASHSAPQVTYSVASNISEGVTMKIVTKQFVEGLGVVGTDTNDVNSIVAEYDRTNLTERINAKQDEIEDLDQIRSRADEGHAAVKVESDPEAMPIVNMWERYWGGSNVVWEVTNYYGYVDIPKLRLLELAHTVTNGVTNYYYREVWNDTRRLEGWRSNITHDVEMRLLSMKQDITDDVDSKIADKADKAWGKYTSAGELAPSGTVWHSSQSTVFAGGFDFQRYAVGEGVISILVNKGAPAFTRGQNGKFMIGDEGGTNYFGFAKTDSYTIGCNTDDITVNSDHTVDLRYRNMVGGTFPVIYHTPTLSSDGMCREQLNTPDGEPIAGATYVVSFNIDGDDYVGTMNVGNSAQGFFKAESQVSGSATFETNMKAMFLSGILCTDGIHYFYPVYNAATGKVELEVH